jgi:hypothetical protein
MNAPLPVEGLRNPVGTVAVKKQADTTVTLWRITTGCRPRSHTFPLQLCGRQCVARDRRKMSASATAEPSGDDAPATTDPRFEIELEFLQCLASPTYLHCSFKLTLPPTPRRHPPKNLTTSATNFCLRLSVFHSLSPALHPQSSPKTSTWTTQLSCATCPT